MKLSDIIKDYRRENDLSLREFAERTNISYSYIAILEKGMNYRKKKKLSPTLDALDKIARAMNMELDDLLAKMNNMNISLNKDTPSYNAIPLLGIVKAGYDYLADQNIIGYVETNVKDKENCFALKVKGDSMQPVLYEGDIIIVHKQEDIESGQVAVVLINENEATVKKVIKNSDSIELIAFNSYYPSKKLKEGFSIIGKVIEAKISKILE